MDKEYRCPKCGGRLAPYSTLTLFLRCQICGLAVRNPASEACAGVTADGKTT